ncbi:MAG: arsenate reductase ArsC [Acidobacteria bacterium]|jgi:arsenate reductase (thioredoxin)|nr:arsenate reductase ArsC [Acidobacteriota bacterium]
MHVLFLCTGNSCRSIVAEALFNHLAPETWSAMSAGSRPVGAVHPRALALLNRKGIHTAALSSLASKSWDNLPAMPDVVITVCGNAARETCPAYLGPAMRAHWGVDDPAKVIGSSAHIDAAFELAYTVLRERITVFFALPLDTLVNDRPAFTEALHQIGRSPDGRR